MKTILFILDRAHGYNVRGKRSPDGTHIEYKWSQYFIDLLVKDLKDLNIPFAFTVDSFREPGLTNRVRRANELSQGIDYPILLSFHNNAGGGTGAEIFTSPKKDESDKIAEIIATNIMLDFPKIKWRKEKINKLYKERKFTVIAGNRWVKPNYYGILLEWLFMDHEKDLKKLKDPIITLKLKETILYSICEICAHYQIYNFIV